MRDKFIAVLFILCLLGAYALTGFISYKDLCGYEDALFPGKPADARCVCLGSIHMISDRETNRYYCTGLNFSYHNRYLEPLKDNKLLNAYAGKSQVEIMDRDYYLPKDLQSCDKDSDCVLVKNSCTVCCDDCGSPDFDLSINKKYIVSWLTRLDCEEESSSSCGYCCPLSKAVCAGDKCSYISIDR